MDGGRRRFFEKLFSAIWANLSRECSSLRPKSNISPTGRFFKPVVNRRADCLPFCSGAVSPEVRGGRRSLPPFHLSGLPAAPGESRLLLQPFPYGHKGSQTGSE